MHSCGAILVAISRPIDGYFYTCTPNAIMCVCASKNSNATSKGTLRKTTPFVLMNLSKYMSAYVLMSTKSSVWAAQAMSSISDEIKAYSTIYSHHHYRRLLHTNTRTHAWFFVGTLLVYAHWCQHDMDYCCTVSNTQLSTSSVHAITRTHIICTEL